MELGVGDVKIKTKSSVNELEVIFDTKLPWSVHETEAIQKVNCSWNALKIMCKYVNTNELIKLVTTNYFSILIYNSEIW